MAAAAVECGLAVQRFIRFALTDLEEDRLVLSFLPLPEDLHASWPGRILAPPRGSDLLVLQEARELVGVTTTRVALGVCMFSDASEMEAAWRILKQCRQIPSLMIFVALLLPSDLELDAEISDTIMRDNEKLLNLGVADVVINPDMRRGYLSHNVRAMCKTHEFLTQRMQDHVQQALQASPSRESSAQKLEEKQSELKYLLWDFVPRRLMPKLPKVNRSLREDRAGVGQYRFLEACATEDGTVSHAIREDNTTSHVVVKCTAKSKVITSEELDGIYREYVILHDILDHPNIAKCIDILHTEHNLYMVFEAAGRQNLEQFLTDQPGERLQLDQAILCLQQIASALGCMHERDICHRNVTCHHVVVDQRDEDHLHYTLVDFRAAVVSAGDRPSILQVGTFPFMAPEIFLEDFYIPRYADSWSVGILLLEVAGGNTSVEQSFGIDEEVLFNRPELAFQAVIDYFQRPGSHGQALAKLGGVTSATVEGYLEELLRFPPGSRKSMPKMSENLVAASR